MDEYGREQKTSVVGTHNGFSIIKIETTCYRYANGRYSKKYGVSSRYSTMAFCENGTENKPSCRIIAMGSLIEDVKKEIDDYVGGKVVRLTEGEYHKYISGPNHKCGWGFSSDDLFAFLKAYKRGDKKKRYIIEERLTDANFHSFCSLLCNEEYDKFEELVREEYNLVS